MIRFLGPIGVLGVLAIAIVFASLNGGQRVTLDLGLFVLHGVPVTLVAFGGLFAGMLVMLVAGIRTDLKVRQILRQRLAEEDREERELHDETQRDLFDPAPPTPALPEPSTDEPGGPMA